MKTKLEMKAASGQKTNDGFSPQVEGSRVSGQGGRSSTSRISLSNAWYLSGTILANEALRDCHWLTR